MPERISGHELYVTHEKMNGYLTGIIGGAAAMVGSVIGATWYLSSQIAEVRQDVAVVKVKVEGLTSAAIQPGDVQQAQYVLVQLPASEEELKDARIRDILTERRLINGSN